MKPWLKVSYIEHSEVSTCLADSDKNILGLFGFGAQQNPAEAVEKGLIQVPLKQINGQSNELWEVSDTVHSGQYRQINYRQSADLSLAQITLGLSSTRNIEAATKQAYTEILAFLGQHTHPWPLKIWHYFPAITAGDADAEQYRLFCAGRAYAVADNPVMLTAIPAATAIGSQASEGQLLIYFLAGRQPGQMVENPRQTPAPNYPPQYGKRSPLFSRGTLIESGQTHQFLISGTASILGFESLHTANVREQTREALRNLTALISAGRRLAPVDIEGRKRFVRTGGILRVYIKHPADVDVICEELAAHPLGKLPAVYLHGDICREELLVEIDGIF